MMRFSQPRTRALVCTLACLATSLACSDGAGPGSDGGSVAIVINGTGVPLQVLVNGVVRIQTLEPATVATSIPVAAGSNTIEIRSAAGAPPASATTTAAFTDGRSRYIAAFADGTGLAVRAIDDTGDEPVEGASKLRVIHLAGDAGALDIWRTEPAAPTPVRVLAPFPYGTASPFAQSAPGSWEVIVTRAVDPVPENPRPVALATIAIITGDAAVATVVVLDAPGNWVKLALLTGSN